MKKILILLTTLCLVASSAFSLVGCSSTTTINVLNWGEYLDANLLARFESETGIKVSYKTCPDNESMYAAISAPGSKVDVVFPSEYMVQKMRRENLLSKIDYSKLPNAANIAPFIQEQKLDLNRDYSVPYTWGTVGILYDNTKVSAEDASSWNCLFDEKYAKQMYMYNSMRDSFAVALLKLGYNINTKNIDELNQATDLLIAQKPLVKAYGTDDIRISMLNGSGAMGVVYSGDATLAMMESENLSYSIPKEGSNIWLDYVAIPEASKNKEAALAFINFLLSVDVATINCEYIGYSSPIAGVLENMPEEYQALNSFNPSMEEISRCSPFEDLGETEKVYGDLWVKIMSK